MIRTPPEVTANVLKLCAFLRSSNPVRVQIRSELNFQVGRCHYNVDHLAEMKGGKIVWGWAIYDDGLAEPSNTAQFHAVLRTSDGQLIDPTPSCSTEPSACTLFSADTNRSFDFGQLLSWWNVVHDPSSDRFFEDIPTGIAPFDASRLRPKGSWVKEDEAYHTSVVPRSRRP